MSDDWNRQWIEVFRACDYGEKGAWTVADLERIAAAYNPATHAAPVVIGHPKDDAPAWGWVKRLRRAGDSLWAQLTKLAPEFEELVRQGRFLQRSVSLYTHLPLAGGPYLRHLGFLGAQPPEIKGLRPMFQFSERRSAVVDFGDTAPEKLPTKTVAVPRINLSGRITVDPVSVELADEATLVSRVEEISYGEALRVVRQRPTRT